MSASPLPSRKPAKRPLAPVIPLRQKANGAALPPPRVPRITEQGRAKYLQREGQACGPVQFAARLQAVVEARRDGEEKIIAGSLEDLAAAAIVWADRIRKETGIWPK